MFGAPGGTYATGPRFQVHTSWRYFKSDRHFVGPEFQGVRKDTKSQFINRVLLGDVGFKFLPNDRWAITANLPIQKANRNQPLRIDGVVISRFDYNANGIGDMTITGRRWMLRPDTHPYMNFTLGVGIKLPTGDEDAKDYRWTLVNGVPTRNAEKTFVDQSIQPGDGGTGFITDFQWFKGVNEGKLTFYVGATYMISPNSLSAARHSASDQYLGRVGAVMTGPKWKGWAVGLGGRLEGVPWSDAFGEDTGSRRPGYGISIEPSASWRKGPHGVNMAMQWLEYANRTRSKSDRDNGRGPGDAAFAQSTISFGYTYRFGKPTTPRTYEPGQGEPIRDKRKREQMERTKKLVGDNDLILPTCPIMEVPEDALPQAAGL